MLIKKTVLLVPLLFFSFSVAGQDSRARYEPGKEDEVLKAIEKEREALEQQRRDLTRKIRQRQETEKEQEKKRVLRAGLEGVSPPESPDIFTSLFHFPPQAQYYTATCWSYCTTSFLETEIFRITGRKIKLAEMWAPYFEMVEKCRRYIEERGESFVSGGAESNSVTRIWKTYGIVPATVYPGLQDRSKHDHVPLMREIRAYLDYIREHEIWDVQENLRHIRLILNRHMGKPPARFTYQGRNFTPLEFLAYTGLNLDDYVACMSTSYFPFYTRAEFRVPDNWWHSDEYVNLPLDVWYGVIKKALAAGYSVNIGGDVSEPGKVPEADLAFVPAFDIPLEYINQDSREHRIANHSTTDDHGVHVVGYKRYKDHDWFLIKDSGRSARRGRFPGYYFFRGDFIRLKMLTFMVHRDMVSSLLPKLTR